MAGRTAHMVMSPTGHILNRTQVLKRKTRVSLIFDIEMRCRNKTNSVAFIPQANYTD
jgi:hypothetical protein